MIESFGKFMYRIPGFSFTTFQKECNKEEIDIFLREFFSNEKFLSAVRLASKDFYDEITRFQEGHDFGKKDLRKFRETAIKYISRMCCRSTPFGLFSGCGIGSIGEGEDEIQPYETLGSKVRLDMGFLTSVAEYLVGNEKVRKYFKFFKNNTTYKLGNKFRYVEYKVNNGERLYNLSSVEENEVLEEIMEMAKNGCFFDDIVQHLQNDFTIEEIQPYFNELVDSRILISELEPVMTGIEYEEQFIDIIGQTLGREMEEDVRALLNHVQEILGSYKKIVNNLESERRSLTDQELLQLTAILKELPNKYNVKDFIQTDSFSENHAANISEQTLKEVIEGIEVITRLSNVPKSRIDDFKSAFHKRYDSQIVPLSEVMDPEAGIGYGLANNELLDFTPFVDSMPAGRVKRKSGGGESQLNWRSEVHGLFYNKIKQFSKTEQPDVPGIQLTAADLESLPKKVAKLPPTFNAVMSLYQEDAGKRWIEFKRVGSTSATCLLGRFGYLSEGTGSLLNEIAAHESQFYGNKIVAEINHLSDIRVGNVLQRPKMREFEICYLTKSNTTESTSIELSDLYLMYRNGNLILFSKSLGKQVVPRLSNAHNYYKDTLPVYKFLSDLQEFEVGGGYISVGIDIGPMNQFFDHIPRITYKNCILHLAHWYIRSSEYKRMLGEKEADLDLQEKFIAFFEKRSIPTKFLFVDGDYDIFVDLNNFLSFGNFIRDIKNKTLVVIKEALIVEGKALVRNSTGQYFHEIMMPLKHMQTTGEGASDSVIEKAIATLNKAKGAVVKRSYTPGEEWLYFKIYAGVKVCDELIKTDLHEIVTHLKETGVISKWFFIRYNDDGGFHLRVRLLLTDVKHCGEIMTRFSTVLASKIKNGVVKSLNIDTYERELERYGHALISPAESIFQLDSDFCMETLKTIRAIGKDDFRWLFCLATMYAYLDAFKLSEKRIYSFSKLARDNFGEEFNADKMQKRYFITKYASLKSQMDTFFADKQIDEVSQEWFFVQLKKFKTRLSEVYETFYSELKPEEAENYLRSFIHMNNVRFFSSKNRMHEYALYCLIEQHYKYKLSREEHLSKLKASAVPQ